MDEGQKLFERMLNTRHGWKERDLEILYSSFGFAAKESTRHRKYWHPQRPELYAFVPRHRSVKAVYVASAIKLILRLKEIQQNESKK